MATYAPYQPGPNQGGLQNLQSQAVGGLSGLMAEDYDANRQQYQDALYGAQESNITQAMEKQLDRLVEGQFGRGMGLSSPTVDMVGETNENYFDALADASRQAYLGAGAENRADLATRQGLYTGGFNAATQGIQTDAQIALANAQRQQQGSQFDASLAAQQQAQQAQQQQYQSQMQFNYAQLAQQAKQFGATLDYNTQQALMNRAQQMTLANMQNQFQYAQLGQQGQQFGSQMDFNRAQLAQQDQHFGSTLNYNTTQADLNRAQQMGLANMQLGFNYAQLGQQGQIANNQLGFNYAQLGQQGGQFLLSQDQQRAIAANALAFQYAQLAQNDSHFNAGLDAQSDARSNAALGAGLTGLAGLFAPTLNSVGGAANKWLTDLFGLPSAGAGSDDILRQLGLIGV